MRVSYFRVVWALGVVLLLSLLAPACVLGALPTTVEGQADWLADAYGEALELSYTPPSSESIQVSRAEVAQGLRSVIAAPLTRHQLRELDQWIGTDAVQGEDVVPPDLQLHAWAADVLEVARLYLSRPPLTPELHRAVMAQAGLLFDSLREELAAQFLGVMSDAEVRATGAVFGDTFLVSAAATSPVSPFMKRLFTPAEMDMLVQYARDQAIRARQDWDDAVARASRSSEAARAMYTPSLAESVYFNCAAAVLQYKILRTSYVPPEVLTEAEQRAVMQACEAQREAQRATAAPAESGGQ